MSAWELGVRSVLVVSMSRWLSLSKPSLVDSKFVRGKTLRQAQCPCGSSVSELGFGVGNSRWLSLSKPSLVDSKFVRGKTLRQAQCPYWLSVRVGAQCPSWALVSVTHGG